MDFCIETDRPEGYELRTLVVPGHPEESYLLEKLTSTRTELCRAGHWPRMPPLSYPPLAAAQIAMIRDWIQNGASR